MPFNLEPDKFGKELQDLEMNLFEGDMESDPLWDILSAYADGEATEEEALQIELLLKSDAHLAQELHFLQSTHQIIVTTHEVEPPSQLRSQILAATSQRLTLRRRIASLCAKLQLPTFALRQYAIPMGAITATAMVTFLLLNRQAEQHEQSPIPAVKSEEKVAMATPPSIPELPWRDLNTGNASTAPVFPKQNADGAKPNTALHGTRTPVVARANTPNRNSLYHVVPVADFRPHRPLPIPRGVDIAQKPSAERNLISTSDPEKDQEPKMIPTDFTPQPMMESENQRPVVQMAKATTEIPEVRNHEPEPTESASLPSATNSTSASERLKARLRQSRQILLADRNYRTPSDGVFRGATIQDANVRLVENMKRSQSSALFVKQF